MNNTVFQMNMMRMFPNSNISKQIRQANQSEYKTISRKQVSQGKKNKKHFMRSSRDLKTEKIITASAENIGLPTPAKPESQIGT